MIRDLWVGGYLPNQSKWIPEVRYLTGQRNMVPREVRRTEYVSKEENPEKEWVQAPGCLHHTEYRSIELINYS